MNRRNVRLGVSIVLVFRGDDRVNIREPWLGFLNYKKKVLSDQNLVAPFFVFLVETIHELSLHELSLLH